MPFRRKKKKKDLPKPPSFSEEDDSPFAGPPRELLKPPQVKRPSPPEVLSEQTGPLRDIKFTESPKTSELVGPPRVRTPSARKASSEPSGPPRGPPPIREAPIFEGPPRRSPTRDTSIHPNLPTPPPFSSEQSREPVPLFDDGAITNEIHAELRKRKFGSDMEKTPKRKAVSIPTDELTKRHFRETRQNYIEAGNKHLELNFYANAATNYACAIFCDLIIKGWKAARQTMSELSTGTPSSVTDNNIFDSARLTIEAIRTRNFNFITRAERTIQNNTEHLYPEDIAIIERALKAAKAELGYG